VTEFTRKPCNTNRSTRARPKPPRLGKELAAAGKWRSQHTSLIGRIVVVCGLRLRHPEHGADRVLVVVGHVTHVFHDADDLILGHILDLVRAEMLAERVLVFEESPGEGFIDHGYGAGGGRVLLQDDKEEGGCFQWELV
jgi:hypothetical protein